jgi:uncharacterized membrane protein
MNLQEDVSMWTRGELKSQAKFNLRSKYWIAFLVSVIVSLLGAGNSFFSWRSRPGSFKFDEVDWQKFQNGDFQQYVDLVKRFFDSGIFFITLTAAVFAVLIAAAYHIFISSVIQAGGCRWFSRSREAAATPRIGQVFSLFKAGSYMKTVGSMLWMNLFLFLWGLLAILPTVVVAVVLFTQTVDFSVLKDLAGNLDDTALLMKTIGGLLSQILPAGLLTMLASVAFAIPFYVKTYSYRMTPWILADNPRIGYRRALQLSMELTRGHKLNIWVLDLSFIGWIILGALACGIGVIFVWPYYYAVQAELFANLRQNGVDKGLCTMEEFGFVRVDAAGPGTVQPAGN